MEICSLVGARKKVLDIEEINSPLKELLKKGYVVQILADGTKEHKKAELAVNKVLVKSYKQKRK